MTENSGNIQQMNADPVKSMNGDQILNGLSNGYIEAGSNGISSGGERHKSSSKDKHRDKDRDHKSSKSSHRDKDKHSSSSGKDKHRDKDRDKDKDRHRSSKDDKPRSDKDRDKDKEKERSDKNKDRPEKDKDRSEKDKDRSEKDKDRSEKDKDRSEKDKDRSEKDKDRSEKDKDRSEKDKHHKSSSSSKDKHSSSTSKSKDKDREKRDKEKDRDKDRHKSSKDEKSRDDKHRKKDHKSSHSKERSEKDRERDKEKSDRNKDRDKERSNKDKEKSDRDKERPDKEKSERDKDKDRHHKSSSSKSKDKDRDRDRKDKDRHRDRKEKRRESKPYDIKNEVKLENNSEMMSVPPLMKELKVELEMLNPEDYKIKQEHFNASQTSSCDYSMSQFRDDEPRFDLKKENDEDEEDFNQNEDTINSMSQDPLGLSNMGDENDINQYDEEDIPLSKRKIEKMEESEEDVPLISRKIIKKDEKKIQKIIKREHSEDDEDDYSKPKHKKVKKEKHKNKVNTTNTSTVNVSPTKGGRKKKEEEDSEVWRWWEEEKRDDGIKWSFLEHKGPVFAPPYIPLPSNVKFYYDGKVMHLSQDTEEIACFYAKMLTHDYVTKQVFNENFFKDWRKSMTSKEKETIRDLRKCDFKEINTYFTRISEQNKNRSKEEKLRIKVENETLLKEYGFCTIDGHKEKIGNFKIEPPGLFRGRGEHPKMGLVKRRLEPEDILINCSKNSKIPTPPKGHKWREVRHDNTVSWLASWTENVQGQVKYIMLNPSSKIKGEKDHQKYETARRLAKHIEKIRNTYRDEWKSKEMRIRQRGVALYFIDKLALRAGNEKDEDQADTVGCCSLRVEHVKLEKELNGKENVVIFDFLGKDSIRYYNEVSVEKRVFKNLELFMENKKEGDELFDRLNTSILNDHLKDLMDGLTAKVFRTYNASITLQNQLDELTDPNSTIPEKLLSYNRANRAVAVLCNHQRSVPKSHEKSMENLKEKIRVKREAIDDCENEYQDLKRQAKRGSVKEKLNADKKQKQLERLKEQLKKFELQETDRDENKTIALGTSKLNYLDPRISVAWCKKHNVPIEKIFNKTQRDKFRWAIHMANENYRF